MECHLRTFSAEEQRAAVALYRELAKGKAVTADQLGRVLGMSPEQARAMLHRDSIKGFVYPDDQGRVLGFGGLAAAPMHHRFEVDGQMLSTWCAWDSLFIPEILGRSAHVRILLLDKVIRRVLGRQTSRHISVLTLDRSFGR
jgi:hypothetical protein